MAARASNELGLICEAVAQAHTVNKYNANILKEIFVLASRARA
jgi:hypothetical protein